MKPIGPAVVPLRVLAPSERLAPPATAAVPHLGEATSRTPPADFEQALREAVADLREVFQQVQAEGDPLTRHLALRQLARDVSSNDWDVSRLTRKDEQTFARELVRDVVTLSTQSAERLDPLARGDLEVLLRFEGRLEERAALEVQREAAGRTAAQDAARRDTLRRELEEGEAREAAMVATPAFALRYVGVLLAFFGVVAFLASLVALAALVLGWPLPVVDVPSGPGSVAAPAVLAVVAGAAWWSVDPRRRRAWLVARLVQVRALLESQAQAEARSKATLDRALALWAKVDAECRAEEAAAEAVFRRRPGVARYVQRPAPR